MRLSELAGKRILNLYDGEIIGSAGESDLLIDPKNGAISEILIPPDRGMSGCGRGLSIPWAAVKKVGAEVIVIDLEYD